MCRALEKALLVRFVPPSSAGMNFIKVSPVSIVPLELGSVKIILPASQAVPLVAQAVAEAAMQIDTLVPLVPALLRAKDMSVMSSLICRVRRVLVMNCVKLGTAMPNKMAKTNTVIISSIRVTPLARVREENRCGRLVIAIVRNWRQKNRIHLVD